MNLLVDIGNSRLKWGLYNGDGLVPGTAIDYRQASFRDELRVAWQAFEKPAKLALASVAEPELATEIADLARCLWPALDVIVPHSTAKAFGVRNAYKQPAKLGIDRWLALLAAHRYYPGANCIVDCGTAITVDAIDAGGRHLGGLICPGLQSMKKALAADTVALNFNPPTPAACLADTTVAAIEGGTLLAAVGLIETVIGRQHNACRLILTGGDAETIAGQLRQPCTVDTALVLKGLGIYCNTDETT